MGKPYMRLSCALLVTLAVLLLPSLPAQATFPGQNGKIAFSQGNTVFTVAPDGSNLVSLGAGVTPAWSPDGTLIAFSYDADIYLMAADGSARQRIVDNATSGYALSNPAWSPDGGQIIFNSYGAGGGTTWTHIHRVNSDGTEAPANFTTLTCTEGFGDWSPDGVEVAFFEDYSATFCGGRPVDIYTIRPDGTGGARLTFDGNTSGSGSAYPSWSPDNTRIAYGREPVGTAVVKTMNADGSGAMTLQSGNFPVWSPDGTKIAFTRADGTTRDLWVMGPDGSGPVRILDSAGEVSFPKWQPIPVNSYPRPKGATPTQVSMVPTYAQCTSPNRTHGPPLPFSSCNPPAQTSDELTVGTADSNGKPTKSRGLVRYEAIVGTPSTPADEADVRITVELFDIYEQGSLADYAGELRARSSLRITDKLNHPFPGGPQAGTVSDAVLGATVPCAATPDTTEGASCNLVTTFDAVVPGTVPEGKRSIWALGAVQLDDGGADGDADTPGDNTLFMTQGLFIP